MSAPCHRRPWGRSILPVGWPILALGILACAGLGACGPGGGPGASPPPPVGPDGVRAVFVARTAPLADFYEHPFPSDARRRPDGTLDLTGFPAPIPLLATYVEEFQRDTLGFGPSAAIYLRFEAALDETTLGDPALSTTDGAPAYVVDVDPRSPERGRRAPVTARFRAARGRFIGSNSLVLAPVPGFPLRPATTYAAIVTTRVRAAGGGPLARAADFEALLGGGGDEAVARARAAFAPLIAWLDERPSERAGVVVATCFTTQDPVAAMFRLREAVGRTPAPVAIAFERVEENSTYVRWRGRLPIPIFQQGTPPYATPAQGGRIDLAPAALAPARTEEVRFALTLPLGEMPAAGWPLVLYSHGTGGSYESFLGDGTATRFARPDDDGQPLPPLAVLGIDQVLHGPRDPTGASPELTFFNYMNPPAARDNVRQGGADEFQVLRLARAGIGPLRFDPQRIYFMGHSQGGITGPPFLAAEPDVPAAVLSGAGGHLVLSLLHKTQPVDLPALLRGLLGEDLDESHPVLNLLQTYIEPADPLNYGRLFFREPPAGMRPKSIYQSMGLVDHFTPVPTIAAFALAMGVDAVAPLLEPIPGLDLTGRAPVARPVAGNVAGGAATGVLAQYSAGGGEGHFVLFRVAQAQRDHVRFLRNHARDGVARLGP